MSRRRDEWEALDKAGICPECRNPQPCREKSCPRFWFDYGYSKGFHDGANKMPRHDHAFVVEMIEMDLYSNGDDEV